MIVTKCCNAAIIKKCVEEYPDGPLYSFLTVAPACGSCGEEHPETVDACDMCGEPATGMREIDGDQHCPSCIGEQLEAIMQELRERTGLGV